MHRIDDDTRVVTLGFWLALSMPPGLAVLAGFIAMLLGLLSPLAWLGGCLLVNTVTVVVMLAVARWLVPLAARALAERGLGAPRSPLAGRRGPSV